MNDPQRTCVGCRKVTSAAELVRYVVHDGVLVRDDSGSLPGRGAWLHDDPECRATARRKGAFSRAFRAKIDDQVLDC